MAEPMGKSNGVRRVKVSSQMHLRIPRDLYERYGFGNEAEVVPTAKGVKFRPVKTEGERCADLPEVLASQGLGGETLVQRIRSESQRQSIAIEYQSEGHER